MASLIFVGSTASALRLSALIVFALASPRLRRRHDDSLPRQGHQRGHRDHQMQGGKHVLTVSSDFVVPGYAQWHWQVVDAEGNAYLLAWSFKDDEIDRVDRAPASIQDIAKVQMWCAWAEVLLGEASFTPADRDEVDRVQPATASRPIGGTWPATA